MNGSIKLNTKKRHQIITRATNLEADGAAANKWKPLKVAGSTERERAFHRGRTVENWPELWSTDCHIKLQSNIKHTISLTKHYKYGAVVACDIPVLWFENSSGPINVYAPSARGPALHTPPPGSHPLRCCVLCTWTADTKLKILSLLNSVTLMRVLQSPFAFC